MPTCFLEALDQNSEAKLLADPSITVGDRTEASIRIVQQIPIVGANPVEGSNAVFTQTEFKEAGVILVVTPRISRDGTIELQVQPEYSVVSEITPQGPVIDTRTADTIVRVNNGQMFVLGGLRQKSIVETVRGIPYLREISVVGKLFRAHSTEVRESELIVFLKPELITPYYNGHPRETNGWGVLPRTIWIEFHMPRFDQSFPTVETVTAQTTTRGHEPMREATHLRWSVVPAYSHTSW